MSIRTIDRYLFKEALTSFLAVLLVLMLILVGGVFVKLLGKVVDGSIEAGYLLPLLTWGALKSVSTLIAVSLFLGVLLALGRMYKDNEIYALRASGMSDRQLLRPFLWLGSLVATVLLVLSFWLEPLAERKIQAQRADAIQNINLAGITPGKFVTMPGSSRVIFAEHAGENKDQLGNIYLFEELEQELRIVTAATADQKSIAEYNGEFLELSNGRIFQGTAAAEEFTAGNFEQMGFRLPSAERKDLVRDLDMMSVTQLRAGGTRQHLAELQWRISNPISIFILVLLAVALSYSGPRQGRFGSLATAILVYIFYVNLLGLGKDMIEKGTLPEWMGLWWVHLLFLIMAVFILAKQNRYIERLLHRPSKISQTQSS